MARVLFLDFDGVLHPAGTKPGESLPFEWLPELAALLSSTPDVALAVHSSRVGTYPVDELREFLGPLGCRFIGAVGPGPKPRRSVRSYAPGQISTTGSWSMMTSGSFQSIFRRRWSFATRCEGLQIPEHKIKFVAGC
ncbi:hypothetical protein HK414_23225 [Ramlibacter terrae]|uniref:Uncharacterized protein n=1 Tax=Ramlibacter terrae TaxID=2732511 RepID=A0ABX6P535_9BURK|nr:hypothetical protein HK414_23225 [Ramlibacter terrae]